MVSQARKPQRIKELVEASRFWDAEDLIRNLDEEMDRMEDGMGHVVYDMDCRPLSMCLRPLPVTPHFEVSESDKRLDVSVHLPGVSKDDVRLNVDRDGVEVSAIPSDNICRPYYLRVDSRDPLAPDQAMAKFSDGVLKVVAPRAKKTRLKVR